MLKRNNYRIGLAVCVLLFMIVGYVLIRPSAPVYAPYLSFSPAPDGIKAIVDLLREKGQTTGSWEQPWDRLPAGKDQMLLVVQPNGLTVREFDDIQSWMEADNDVLLFTNHIPDWDGFRRVESDAETGAKSNVPAEVEAEGAAVSEGAEWSEGAGASEPARKAKEDEVVHTIRLSGAAPNGTRSVEAIVTTPERLAPEEEIEELFRDEQGIIGARKNFGKGTLTVVLGPQWLTNGKVLEQGHADLVLPLLDVGRKTLWIDEYHHGFSTVPGLAAAFPAWLLALGAQLGLALLLLLWMRAKRIGRVHVPREWTVRRGDETLVAAAGWYERRRLRSEALAHGAQRLRQLLAERWGVTSGASPREAAEVARIHWDAERAGRLERLLHDAELVQQQAAAGRAGGRGGNGGGARRFTARAREYGEFIAAMEKE